MIPIVYSRATGRIRQIYELDKGDDPSAIRTLPGEAIHSLDGELADYMSAKGEPLLHELQAILNDVTGLNPEKSDDLYAVVDPQSGAVVGCVTCDPDCGDKIDSLALLKMADADKLMEGHKVDETTRTKLRPGVVERDAKDVVIIEPVKPTLPPKRTDTDIQIDTPVEEVDSLKV
mgnify:CR=1 FL=1